MYIGIGTNSQTISADTDMIKNGRYTDNRYDIETALN